MIRAVGVVKRRCGVEVLRGVSLEVARGEVAVIVGPSGCGKSTFLRCLNGLEMPDAGEVEVDGIRLPAKIDGREARGTLLRLRRRIGMVFQDFNLFPHLSVLGNVIEAPRRVLRLPREEAEEEARQLLERVGLGDKLDRRPASLSGGEQQRVAIARALAMRPAAVLFDEPTSALDPAMAAEVQAVLADLARSGWTMVVVTHAMGFARSAAHRVHVFDAGRVAESGPPEQVFGEPREEATRRFLAALKYA